MFNIQSLWEWVRTHITRVDVFMMLGILIAFFVTRLIQLDALPIFSDEGIYVQWSRIAWKDASMRFVSLTDGRQPLQTWGMIPFLKLLPYQPLIAGRLFSVATGLYALAGMFVTAWYLFGKRAAYSAAALYVITPYFLFYDRIALIDSAINASTIWMFFLTILLARTRRLDVALVLGFVTGIALLGKSSVRMYAGLGLLASMFVLYEHSGGGLLAMIRASIGKLFGKNNRLWQFVSFLLLYGVSMAIALLMYNVQRLSPYMHTVELKNTTFVLTLPELLQTPFAYFPHNIVNIPYYIFAEMGYVVAALGVIGLYVLYKKDRVLAIYMSLWLLLSTLAIAFVAKVLFPRYVLSLGGLLVLPAAYVLSQMRGRLLWLAVGGIAVSAMFINSAIWFAPTQLPFPAIDRGQYLEGWPAGFGAEEIVQFAREQSIASGKRVFLIAQGDFGMSGDVLRTFIHEGESIHVRAHWPLDDVHLYENQPELGESLVYVVYSHCKEPNHGGEIADSERCSTFEQSKPLTLIRKFEKPGDKNAIYLFELLPAGQ